MTSIRDLYLHNVGQTNDMPLMLEVERAEGVYIYDTTGKAYLDMNSGIAVSSLGHCHPNVVAAIHDQSAKYMHTMVYGEHIQSPQVQYAKLLLDQLDPQLAALYYLSSGTEAVELGVKLAKKHTGRYEIVACKNAYHGSTMGSESLRSDLLQYKSSFMPLVPGVRHISFNAVSDLDKISCRTAGVICEVVQGEAGVINPEDDYLQRLRQKCDEVGALLIFDEIQSGFGRTGELFAHQKKQVIPDVLLIGKAMGGGMPLAGVISSHEIMNSMVKNPALGHITTFGGHPVACAAALATLQTLLTGGLIESVSAKETFIREKLGGHPIIKEVRSMGLMMAVEPIKRKYLKHIVTRGFDLGVLVVCNVKICQVSTDLLSIERLPYSILEFLDAFLSDRRKEID